MRRRNRRSTSVFPIISLLSDRDIILILAMRKQVSKPTRLEQIRRARGIPRYVLAAYAGVSMGTVCAWEIWGIVPSKRETVEKIARALNVSPEELLEDSEGVSEA